MREMVGGCCVCSDDRGWSENPLVYCDGQSCTVAVHQACYGIVTVPTGPWYCRKCESQERSVKVDLQKCELCPSKYGALKKTDNSGWAHVVCALYIPEVRFGNVTTMEPIQLQLIPAERFNKVCYICEEKGKPSNATVGACMQCNKAGCKQQFHVTCAQGLGLLCEEAGNYLDNVKYCGYCQHHYSKLKKGGNVKTIPPYKPVSTENQLSDSNSEKETESGGPSKSASPSNTKRKSGSSGKSTSKTTNSNSKSSSQQKSVHGSSSSSSSKSLDKPKSTSPRISSSKTEEVHDNPVAAVVGDKSEKRDSKTDLIDSETKDSKDNSKLSKKRKANSRTPTPVSVGVSGVSSDLSAVVTTIVTSSTSTATSVISEKKTTSSVGDSDKSKKIKIDTTQSIIISQPVVALTSISTIKPIVHPTTVADTATDPIVSALPVQSIIQQTQPPVNSLVVSVPLASTSLSPNHPLISNQTSVLATASSLAERSVNPTVPDVTSPGPGTVMTGGNSNPPPPPPPPSANMLTSEMTASGLKITFEKQDVINSEVDMDLEISPGPTEEPPKRINPDIPRSHLEKTERPSRNKKRNGGTNGGSAPLTTTSTTVLTTKRSSRSQQVSSSSPSPSVGAFSSINQQQIPIKDSPPSSPESADASSNSRSSRSKTRKSAPAAVNTSSTSSKDNKDLKLFQNGVTAPHMLGNQLNPNSNMAQKMSDHLNSELEAHSIFNPNDNASNLIGPQLHHRVVQSARASSTGGSSTASGGSGLSSMLGGSGGNIPQTLDQLLERQWEQGSQFLMEQAQHFDIASLLSCLHQLRAENLRLEEHVSSLLQRRDHLLAVNARLAIPLTGQPNPQPNHPHTVNNIHPNVTVNNHNDIPRPNRISSGGLSYQGQGGAHHNSSSVPVENGLPPEQYVHRSSSSQPSPTIRHSPAGSGYSNSGIIRQNSDAGGRGTPRNQQFPLYQGSGQSQPQMVMRRDSDGHHASSSKPS